MQITRLDNKSRPLNIDQAGSNYITHLLEKLAIADKLAAEVASLHSNFLSIGAGKMANLKEMADKFLTF